MDLPTPIRNRGKKRNRAQVSTHISNTLASTNTKRPRIATSKTKSTAPAMPTLLGLPQELLEIIFLYSMNISLPRASYTLGRRLSSKAICLSFCMQAFFYTTEHRPMIAHRDRVTTSDPKLQSQVLTCRFYTWDFFLSYVERAHTTLVKLRGKGWAKTGVMVPDHKFFEGLWPYKFMKITYLGFGEGFRMPVKLLHGPWDEGKVSLLYVLVSMSGEVDWEGSVAGETASEGLKEALREGNERAVAALAVLLGVKGRIGTDVLREAVVECGCEVESLRHLLFNAQILYRVGGREILDFYDQALWEGVEKVGGDRGELVKDMLKKAEKFSLQFYFEGQTDWQSIVPLPYSGARFDARTTLNNLAREMLVLLYRNYGRRITGGRPRMMPVGQVTGAEETWN